jgi:hypothetical protein
LQSLNVLANGYRAHNCRILKGVCDALQEELSDFLEIRGSSLYIYKKNLEQLKKRRHDPYQEPTNCDIILVILVIVNIRAQSLIKILVYNLCLAIGLRVVCSR